LIYFSEKRVAQSVKSGCMKIAQLYPKPAFRADTTSVQKILKTEENYH
jgi:hypothetical protein